MIIHFFNDEDFVDWAIDQYETVAPQQHRYLVLTDKPIKELRRVKYENTQKITITKALHPDFLSELTNYDAVCFHFLTLNKAKIINAMPPHRKIVWLCWGKDAYNEQFFDNYFLEKTTRKLADKNGIKYTIKKVIKLTPLINKLVFPEYFIFQKAFRKINYLAPMIKDEYKFLTQHFKLSAKYIPFAYGSLEDVLGGFIEDKTITGKNDILLGNSRTATNNHIEALDILKHVKEDFGIIHLPLNYGNKQYGEIIEQKASAIFPLQTHFLKERVSIDEYTQLMMDCGIVIMNHIRQQAGGNVIMALWLGAKVFLNNKSLYYSFFKRVGVKCFSIQDDLLNHNNVLEPLNKEDIENTKSILLREFSKTRVLEKTTLFCDELLNK